MKMVRSAASEMQLSAVTRWEPGPQGKEMSLGSCKNTHILGQGLQSLISSCGQLQSENAGFSSGAYFSEKRMLQNDGWQIGKEKIFGGNEWQCVINRT